MHGNLQQPPMAISLPIYEDVVAPAIKQILSGNRCPATVERIFVIESHRGCLNDRYHPRRRTAVVPPGDFETATVLQRQHHRVEREVALLPSVVIGLPLCRGSRSAPPSLPADVT